MIMRLSRQHALRHRRGKSRHFETRRAGGHGHTRACCRGVIEERARELELPADPRRRITRSANIEADAQGCRFVLDNELRVPSARPSPNGERQSRHSGFESAGPFGRQIGSRNGNSPLARSP